MKIQLELVIHSEMDNRKFLNFWDLQRGQDVCCQVINGELFLNEYNEEEDSFDNRKISISEFIELVEEVN